MNEPKKHHYNPRYYLQRFQNPSGSLWRLDKHTGMIVKGSAKTLGYKKYWNRITSPPVGTDPNFFEHFIADIDSSSERVIAGIINREPPGSIAPLAVAISFMQNHQPRLKEELKGNHAKKVSGWTDDNFLAAGINSALGDWQEYIPVNYAVLILPDDKPDLRFVTSSNPLISYENKPRMFLPISNRHCLLLNNGADLAWVGNGCMTLNDETHLAEINEQTIQNSWQYVYSCRPDFDPL